MFVIQCPFKTRERIFAMLERTFATLEYTFASFKYKPFTKVDTFLFDSKMFPINTE